MIYRATKDFNFNGVFYDKGDPVDINTKEQLIMLNEKGFIGPLTPKQIQDFGKVNKETKDKEEI